MSTKFFIYLFTTPIVLWAMESININSIFKKNRNVQATLFYALITLALIYIIGNFIYDFTISIEL